jgi:hypothetical protein
MESGNIASHQKFYDLHNIKPGFHYSRAIKVKANSCRDNFNFIKAKAGVFLNWVT